ncbi:uncharacterized protein LOC125489246 [Plutella xylostella]|uniref:uncharacterized protein LOC125489246 n=1 Tax=Plutella xylostella TaxID=51655 RepID=UPI002032D0C5|nr:uncharacterized protein LOC125489246 [Plutella xylostella]
MGKDYQFKANIPAQSTEITGIIKNVPTNLTNKKIFTMLSSYKKIISVRRFTKRTKIDNNFILQPLQTVAITFATSVLPDYVDLDGPKKPLDLLSLLKSNDKALNLLVQSIIKMITLNKTQDTPISSKNVLEVLNDICNPKAQGIYAALEYIEATNLNFNKWLIISDSMSVLMALSNPSYSSGTNYIIYNIRQIYSRLWLNQDREIRFIWTPSHIDVSGNDLADKLASSIVKNPNIQQIPVKNIKLPGSDCKVLIKNIIKDQWMTHWHETIQIKGKWFSSINSEITQPWFIKGKFINRNFYSTICRLRLGHGRFNEHLFRLKMIPSPNCTYCNNDIIQSLDHIFFDCSAFNIQRIIFIDNLLDLYKEALDVPRSIQDLLKNTDTFYPIYDFIKNTIGVI